MARTLLRGRFGQDVFAKVIHTGRKHCGKRRNCSLRAISLFLQCFQKPACFPGASKGVIVWEWVNPRCFGQVLFAKVIQTGRKHCGKRRNCSFRAISPFLQCFQKACFPGASKGVIVWEWVNPRRFDVLVTDVLARTLLRGRFGQDVFAKVIHTGRKHCGKRRNCSLRAISLFLQCFQKPACFPGASKGVIVWEWVNPRCFGQVLFAKVIQTGRKHCGKRRNCSFRAISPFLQCFQKACFPGASKGVIVWEWVNPRRFDVLVTDVLARTLLRGRFGQDVFAKVIHTGRKHCGKRRNCSLRAISLFLQCFQKPACFPGASKGVIVWEWVNPRCFGQVLFAKVIQTGRKHCGKRRNCSFRAISPFLQCFQKACFPGASKGVIVWEWVNPRRFDVLVTDVLARTLLRGRFGQDVFAKVIHTGRKHCGKRRNCSLRAISPFLQCFQKVCFPGASKGVIVWEWVNPRRFDVLVTDVLARTLLRGRFGQDVFAKVIHTGRKHCGKRRNCSLRAISPFLQCFQKACFPGVSKGVIVWEWVNPRRFGQDIFAKVIHTGRKHCGKRRNCSLRAISPILQCFQKVCFPGASKGVIVWEWVNPRRFDVLVTDVLARTLLRGRFGQDVFAKVIHTGRKHCGKRRNCSLRAISPFLQCFQKACFPGASKGVIVWEWVNPRRFDVLVTDVLARTLLRGRFGQDVFAKEILTADVLARTF